MFPLLPVTYMVIMTIGLVGEQAICVEAMHLCYQSSDLDKSIPIMHRPSTRSLLPCTVSASIRAEEGGTHQRVDWPADGEGHLVREACTWACLLDSEGVPSMLNLPEALQISCSNDCRVPCVLLAGAARPRHIRGHEPDGGVCRRLSCRLGVADS